MDELLNIEGPLTCDLLQLEIWFDWKQNPIQTKKKAFEQFSGWALTVLVIEVDMPPGSF